MIRPVRLDSSTLIGWLQCALVFVSRSVLGKVAKALLSGKSLHVGQRKTVTNVV